MNVRLSGQKSIIPGHSIGSSVVGKDINFALRNWKRKLKSADTLHILKDKKDFNLSFVGPLQTNKSESFETQESNNVKQPKTKSNNQLIERVSMSRLRKTIAKRLKDAQNTAAILTTFNEVDMSELITVRTEYKEFFEKKHGVKLGFMSFFVKASRRVQRSQFSMLEFK